MQFVSTIRRLGLIAVAAVAIGATGACSRNHDVYDVSANQYRHWDSREDAAYRRWETERSMNHREYARRTTDEQRRYWEWRRNHQT
jgi:hypothetical protein